MTTAAAIALLAGDREDPRYPVTPDDELRAYTALVRGLEELGPRIPRHTNSPADAAYFVQLVERAHRATGFAQLSATDLAQRTLVNELPEDTLLGINRCLADPDAYIDGDMALPEAPATPPKGRPTFKDTTEFLQHSFRIGFIEARDRVRAASRLFPHTDVHGIEQPPKFPLLAEALAGGKASPQQLAEAARKLERLQPEIKQYPNPEELASRLEAQVADSVREEDPRTTNKLFGTIGVSLAGGVKEPSEEVLRAKLGAFYRGTNAGIAEFLLRVRAADAEALLALFAQMDNPRTKAGNRDALAQQASNAWYGADASNGSNGSNETAAATPKDGSRTQPGTAPSLPDFPDFLLDPATGLPLTDPAEASKLTLDPLPTEANILEAMNNTEYGSDGLTPPQRHLQGLMNLIKTNGRPTNGTKTAGLPSPEIFIITTLDELEGRAAQSGLTLHGQKCTPAELRHALCIGGAIPITMNGEGRILDLGTEQRYFPDYMRKAILAIYGGCIFPGCTVPPEHCEIDHDDEWAKGGTTRINDGRPLCSGHHHARHTGQLTVIRDADGLFSVILPTYLDPEQKPRRSTYWRQSPNTPPLF
ncbi:HNH endonuclease [Paeniglutamicibacter sp. ABSL32-1]|uniref:HNH endonuclease signature motif containing protein n=1 Tax=Paeniglutamicibacter quisquiliarum TaxID=2849498 RepID=UPI001C2D9E72|nr:HNH endonuclease signature motif containing protein [Paeniglutamicibacter quisquiliarum]MBV1780257.1 HNH endonuclease [Paeniglutamicibacter quisquiliarum]